MFFFSSRRRHTRSYGDWSSDVCSSDLGPYRRRPDARDARDSARRRYGPHLRRVGPAAQARGRLLDAARARSEERRVGKEGGGRGGPDDGGEKGGYGGVARVAGRRRGWL